MIDASGLVAAPGLIDTHVHFRDPGFTYKENLHTGALASAKGGFTSVICMANTSPVVDNVQTLLDIGRRAKEEKIRIYQAASVSRSLKGEELTNMEELADSGACGFTDDGIPIRSAAFLYEAMEKAASLDLPISLHEEDPSFIKTTVSITALYRTNWGSTDRRRSLRNLSSRGTACWRSAQVLT